MQAYSNINPITTIKYSLILVPIYTAMSSPPLVHMRLPGARLICTQSLFN